MKILIICYTSRADLIFSTPVIRALKVQLDDAEIHYLTRADFQALLLENPYLDKIHLFTSNLWEVSRQLKQESYDCVVDLHKSIATRIHSFFWTRTKYLFRKHALKNWLMVNLKINRLPNVHLTDRFLEAVAPLKIKKDELGLDYFIPEKDEVPQEWMPENFRKEYVALCIQSTYNTKRLPNERIIELCDKINKPIILLGDKADEEAGNVIQDFFERGESSREWEEGLVELNKRARVYNACGKFSFNQMASVLKQARYVFTFDNDLLPVASAFKKEIFSIWGSSILLFGRYPYQTKFTVLENNKVTCRPCSFAGYNQCPLKHFRCMRDIVFDFYLP